MDSLHDQMIGIEPDLTVIIDMDPDVALSRGLARQSGEDRFEDFGAEFQRTLRQGFLDLAVKQPERCVVIDGNQPIDSVTEAIKTLFAVRGVI